MIDGNRKKKNSPTDSANEQHPENRRPDVNPGQELPFSPSVKTYKWYQLGPYLAAHGVRANFVTVVGLCLAFATAFLVAKGYFYVSIVLLTVGGLMDFLDGSVAKAANTVSVRGAFLDSVADRVADAIIFSGVAFYFLDGPHPKYALVPLAILAVAQIISYERAKAETLGLKASGGLMERAERLIFLGIAMALHIVLLEMLGVLLVLCIATAIGRFYRVWMQIPQVDYSNQMREWKNPKVYSIWRSRRGAPASQGKDWYLNYYKRKHGTNLSSRTSRRRATRIRTAGEPLFHFNEGQGLFAERKKVRREKRDQK